MQPFRAVLLFEGFGEHDPIVNEGQPGSFIKGVAGVFRIQTTEFRSLAALLGSRFAHIHSVRSAT